MKKLSELCINVNDTNDSFVGVKYNKGKIKMNNEVWKDVDSYEGLYQVSNLGRVKSLWFIKERILKPRVEGSGYFFVSLY